MVNTTAALASEFATSADAADDCRRSDDSSNDGESAMTAEAGHHGISDAALDVAVATLHRLCGLVDPTTGKHALRDKRYRSLRRVMYELQNGVAGGGMHASIGSLQRSVGASSSAGAEHGDPPPLPHHRPR